MAKLTYANKVALNQNTSIPDENKITDTNMNDIKSVTNENDTRLTTAETKIIPIEKYITATAGSNGDFYVDLDITCTIGTIVNISFPTATLSTGNARLSIDNGVTYKNIFSNNAQLKSFEIQSQSFSLKYDGTNWNIRNSKTIELWSGSLYAAGSSITLPVPLVVNQSYIFTFYGASSRYTEDVIFWYKSHYFQKTFYDGTFRMRLDINSTGTTITVNADSLKNDAGTALIRIGKII